MSASPPSRREFLKAAAIAAGGLCLGFELGGCGSAAQRAMIARAEAKGEFAPNAWLTITPDNRVIFWLDRVEMGQGTQTSHTTLIAEELEVDPAQVQVQAAPDNRAYDNPDPELGFQITGGSTSTKGSWEPLRVAGATARDMLRAAAAERWGAPLAECVAMGGAVLHQPSNRRATYGELARAAAHQPIPTPTLKTAREFRLIGKDRVRLDARQKVTGTAVYGIDVKLPGLLTAVLVRPPSLDGEVERFDAAVAKKQPGVVDVFATPTGVAVVATSYWRAAAAARLVQVSWRSGRLAGAHTATLERQYRERASRKAKVARAEGDIGDGFSDAARVVEASYEAPYLAHATMEPQNCTAHVTDERCDIWAPTQATALVQEVARKLTGLSRDRITVQTTMIGGGFGRRLIADYAAEAILVSKRLRKPVKVVWSREDDMRHDIYRPMTAHALRGAVDRSANVVAWFHRIVGQSITSRVAPEWVQPLTAGRLPESVAQTLGRTAGSLLSSAAVADPTSVQGAADVPYAFPNLRVEYAAVEPGVPVGFWRSVGHSFNAFVVESFLDELAHAARTDPYAMRRALLAENPRLRGVLDLVVEKGGWHLPRAPGVGRGMALSQSFGTPCAMILDASVSGAEVKVHRVVAAVDCGVVIHPDLVRAQVESAVAFGLGAALWQKVTIQGGAVQEANFHQYRLLRMHEMPKVEVHLVPSSEHPNGVGEPGVPPVAPALANAIFAATGKRIRTLPLIPQLEKPS